jgi:DNA-binding NtrC family response regulator
MKPKILIIDTDESFRSTGVIVLSGYDYEVDSADSVPAALAAVSERQFDLILLDLRFVEVTPQEILAFIRNDMEPSTAERIRSLYPRFRGDSVNEDTPVVVMSPMRADDKERQFRSQKKVDWIIKGLDNQALRETVQRNLEVSPTFVAAREATTISPFLGQNQAFKKVLDFIDKISESDNPVLITGESGVGKEIVAKLIWQKSARRQNVWRVCNCTGVTKDMVEDTLFGHAKYAFTGAARERKGILRSAQGGTVFLDEIAETTQEFQAKLLRAIQFGEIQTVGTDQVDYVDVRFLAATNRNLDKEIQEGRFRHDLFYRFTFILEIPSLRERVDDLPRLAAHILEGAAVKNRKPVPSIGDEAMRAICDYSWPGNIRQLQNALEYAIVMARGPVVLREDLPDYVFRRIATTNLPKSIAEAESEAIVEALQFVKGVRTKAAGILGIAPKTLRDKIDRYNLGALFPVGSEPAQEDERREDEPAEDQRRG